MNGTIHDSKVYRTDAGTAFLRGPGVALLAHTRANLINASGFLRGFGSGSDFLDYLDDDVKLPDGEALVKFAGQMCYMSLGPDRTRNENAQKYFDNIKSQGHGSVLEHVSYTFLIYGVDRSFTHELVRHRAGAAYCLSGDTEVWSGSCVHGRWGGVKKKWSMQKLYEMSLDPKRKGRLRLMTVRCFDGEKFVQAKIKGIMSSGAKNILKITLSDGKTIRCSEDHLFLTTDGWMPVRELTVGNVLATNGRPAVDIDRDWLSRRYNQERATLAEIAKEANCSTHCIRKYLRAYKLQKKQGQGMKGRVPPNKGMRYKTGYKHTEENRALLSAQKMGSRNPQWMGEHASQRAGRLRAWKLFGTAPCESCGVEDGHRHHRDRNTLNNDPSNIERLCASCHAKQHYLEDGPTNSLTVRWVPIVSIQPDGWEQTYDLEVDHPAHNFVANGLVTHNSQVSQRYVQAETLRFVERIDHQSDPLLHAAFEAWIDKAAAEYNMRAQLLMELQAGGLEVLSGEKKRDLRKKVNQAARACLPNETEAPIVVTLNARSLRHVIEMRANAAADLPIRQVGVILLQIAKAVSPMLFSDYEIINLADGTQAVNTVWRKV